MWFWKSNRSARLAPRSASKGHNGRRLGVESLEYRRLLTVGPLNYTAPSASALTLTVVAGSYEVLNGASVVASRAVADTNAINITGSIGNDSLTVETPVLSSGLPITFTGNSASDTLDVDDSSNTASEVYSLDGSTFSVGSTAISYSGVSTVDFEPTAGSLNGFSVLSLGSGISLNVSGNGASGANTIVAIGDGGDSLDGQILGNVDVNDVALFGFAEGDATGSPSYTLTNDSITRVGTETTVATYSNLEFGVIIQAPADGSATVKSTAFGITSEVDAGTITVGNSGRLDNIQPGLTVNGSTSVTIDDHSTTAAVNYQVDASTVTRTFLGSPSPTITYSAPLLIVDAGSGSNTIDLGLGEDFGSTNVSLNSGAGGDTINVNMIGSGDVSVQTGGTSGTANSINVQATTTGTTTLTGGDGNDTYLIGAVDHNLDNVYTVVVDGGTGTNSLTVNDSNGTSGTLNNTNPITRSGMGTTVSIAYSNVGTPTLISGT
jgi:hypothetical protein